MASGQRGRPHQPLEDPHRDDLLVLAERTGDRDIQLHPARRPADRYGTLTFAGHSGTNRVAFQGRISAAKKLKRGRYTLAITATNPAGLRSAP